MQDPSSPAKVEPRPPEVVVQGQWLAHQEVLELLAF